MLMNTAEALWSIQYDLLDYIQKKVRVDFDNTLQIPICFVHKGKTFAVHECLGRFRTESSGHVNAFLLEVDSREVYLLYFQDQDQSQGSVFNKGFWVLSFRILNDHELMALYREERKMLLNVQLTRVVGFHGHLCPELVIGSKACEYALKLLSKNSNLDGGISVTAENGTSALDAIQVLVGATIGNQRLKVVDFGKHNYTFSSKNSRKAFRFILKTQHYANEEEYRSVEEKIREDRATLDEVVHLQRLLDSRVEQLLACAPESLFDVERIAPIREVTEMPTVYIPCSKCGQQVLKDRAIQFQDKMYCTPCFQQITTGVIVRNLQ